MSKLTTRAVARPTQDENAVGRQTVSKIQTRSSSKTAALTQKPLPASRKRQALHEKETNALPPTTKLDGQRKVSVATRKQVSKVSLTSKSLENKQVASKPDGNVIAASTTSAKIPLGERKVLGQKSKQQPAPAPPAQKKKIVPAAAVVGGKENPVAAHVDQIAVKPVPNLKSIKKTESKFTLKAKEEEHVDKKTRFDEGWDDLDEGDECDPLMVSEYVVEIYEYLRELEIETKPDPNYMSTQNELRWQMRTILVDWLVDVHQKFRLLPETLYLAINIIDRFLSLRGVSCAKLQLVGIVAMFIASKYEEVCHPTIANFIFMADGGYTEEEVLKAERYILQVLNFGLQYPNPMNFLRRISKAEDYDLQSRTLAKYLMEITLLDHRFIEFVPSLIAAGAVFLARRMLEKNGNKRAWTANLAHYSDYSEVEVLPVVSLMLELANRDNDKKVIEHETIYNKYAQKKFLKASIFVKEWLKVNYTGQQAMEEGDVFDEDDDEERVEEEEEEETEPVDFSDEEAGFFGGDS